MTVAQTATITYDAPRIAKILLGILKNDYEINKSDLKILRMVERDEYLDVSRNEFIHVIERIKNTCSIKHLAKVEDLLNEHPII